MQTDLVIFILLWTLLIIKSVQFTLRVKDNHPNNLKERNK